MPPMTTPDPNTHHRRNRMAERSKPEIDRPQGPAPTELLSTDEVVGDGEEAGRGDVVDVHYVGISHSTGEQFDASWDRGEPLRFQLGVGQVITGRSEEHTSELQSRGHLVCRLLLEKKNN